MSNALQYKASKGFRYISGIFLGNWGGGGVRANLPLVRGGVLYNISPCEAHFSPPVLIIIAQSLMSKDKYPSS